MYEAADFLVFGRPSRRALATQRHSVLNIADLRKFEPMAEPSLELIQRMLQNLLDEVRYIRSDVAELKSVGATMLELMASNNRRLVTVEETA